jgi:hypothetical protein
MTRGFADMENVRRAIEADVAGDRALAEMLVEERASRASGQRSLMTRSDGCVSTIAGKRQITLSSPASIESTGM